MILAIDVGNTNTVIGEKRCKTNMIEIRSLLASMRGEDYEGAILSSVVPALNKHICNTVFLQFGIDTIVVDPKMNMNITIPEKYHEELGADIIVGCVGAAAEYPCPLAVIDMGTASTIFVLDKDNVFLGGTIHTGIALELNALTEKTAQLPKTSFEAPDKVIGQNTEECMRAGVLYGHAGMIDGILDHIEKELDCSVTAVATGGLGGYIVPLCRHEIKYDYDLLIKGLNLLYEKNRPQ